MTNSTPAHPGWTRTCPTHLGPNISLSELGELALPDAPVRGVLAVFVPYAFTPTCHAEVGELTASRSLLESAGIACAIISCDTKFTQAAWSESAGNAWPFMSDFWPHGALSRDFGVFDETSGMAVRGTFLFNMTGNVIDSEVRQPGEKRDFSPAGLQRWIDALTD